MRELKIFIQERMETKMSVCICRQTTIACNFFARTQEIRWGTHGKHVLEKRKYLIEYIFYSFVEPLRYALLEKIYKKVQVDRWFFWTLKKLFGLPDGVERLIANIKLELEHTEIQFSFGCCPHLSFKRSQLRNPSLLSFEQNPYRYKIYFDRCLHLRVLREKRGIGKILFEKKNLSIWCIP